MNTLTILLAAIAIAGGESEKLGRAKAELERHLELVTGRPAAECGVDFVLGATNAAEFAAAPFESRGCVKGGKVYLWGDDAENRPGTLFAVYGFLREVLGVDWVRPGEDGVVFAPQHLHSRRFRRAQGRQADDRPAARGRRQAASLSGRDDRRRKGWEPSPVTKANDNPQEAANVL